MGGIKIGYVPASGEVSKKYAVKLDENNKAYVDVPWTDTVTPAFDDSALQSEIDSQRNRIDNYINNLLDTVQDCTEALLDDAQWVLDNLAEGETGRQINDNIDEYFRQQYGVWDWVDPNDHSQGKVVRTSVIEQNVDSIEAYTGMVVPSGYTGTNLTTALSRIYTDVGRDFQTGEVVSGAGMMADIANLNTDTGNIVTAIASALDLKASQNGSTLNTTADLASVISNGSFTGYSGLNTRVTQAEDNISAESSLMSRVVASSDPSSDDYGKPNSTFKTDVIAGLATTTYADNAAAGAKTSLIASINDKSAGITVFAEKSNGKLESGVTIQADHVMIDANTTVSGKLSALDLEVAGKATINSLNATNATIETLVGNNASFTGDVNATTLIAGDPNGINIRTSSDKIEFCQGSDVRAYFVANGQGMQLHVWDSSGVEHYIDFTNWSQVGGSTYTPVRYYYKYNNGNTNVPFVSDSDLFKGSDDKYYSYNGSSYTLISSRDCYVLESANSYPTHGNGFNGSYVPVTYAYSSNNGIPVAIKVDVNRYIKYTITNGVMGSASSSYIYHSPNYPVSVLYDSNTAYVNTGGRFVNPNGGSSSFQYRYANGTLTNLGQPMPTYNYVSSINTATEYSTNPTVYDTQL